MGFSPVDVKYSDRKRYYESFDTFYRDNSQSGMVGIVTDLLEERLTQYLELTKEALSMESSWMDKSVGHVYLNLLRKI